MADIEAGQFSTRRRVDVGTPAAMILTVDAVVLLVVAVVGVPFLAFFFGDEDGGWHRLWPLFAGWFAAAVLGAACTAAVVGLAGHGRYDARRTGIAATLTCAAVSTVVVTWMPAAPVFYLALSFGVANVIAAAALFYPERAAALAGLLGLGRTDDPDPASAEPELGEGETDPELGGRETDPERGGREADPERGGRETAPGHDELESASDVVELEMGPGFDDVETESDRLVVPGAYEPARADVAGESESRPTLDLQIGATRAARTRAAVLKRRTRGQAALRTFDGVRLPRRARTPR
jgi:hypothetical protein